MILTTHALTGAALGKYIHNPILLVIMAIVMHFTLDTFRHGEYLNRRSTVKNTWWKIVTDLLIGNGIVLAYILIQHPPTEIIISMLLGTFFSMFPDLLTVCYWKLHFKFLEKIFNFHAWVHPYPKGDSRYDWKLRNAANDIIFSTIAIIILFTF